MNYCLRGFFTFALAASTVLTACTATDNSLTASLSGESARLMDSYRQLRLTEGFNKIVADTRNLSGNDFDALNASASDMLTLNGKSFSGLNAFYEVSQFDVAVPTFEDAAPLASVLAEKGALDDDIAAADFDGMFNIVETILDSGATTPEDLNAAVANISSDDMLKALNTSLIYESLQSATAAPADGFALAEGTSKTEIASAGVDALFKIPGVVKTGYEIRGQDLANKGTELDNKGKELSYNEKQQEFECKSRPPTQTCDVAWNTKPGNSPSPCNKRWTCDCPNTTDSATCQWLPNF